MIQNDFKSGIEAAIQAAHIEASKFFHFGINDKKADIVDLASFNTAKRIVKALEELYYKPPKFDYDVYQDNQYLRGKVDDLERQLKEIKQEKQLDLFEGDING